MLRRILIIAGVPHQVLAEHSKRDRTFQDAQSKRRGERFSEAALSCRHQLRSGQHENECGKAGRGCRDMRFEPDLLPASLTSVRIPRPKRTTLCCADRYVFSDIFLVTRMTAVDHADEIILE